MNNKYMVVLYRNGERYHTIYFNDLTNLEEKLKMYGRYERMEIWTLIHEMKYDRKHNTNIRISREESDGKIMIAKKVEKRLKVDGE